MAEQRVSDQAIQRTTERLYDEILDHQFELSDGSTGWTGYGATDGEVVLRTEQGLYAGQLGIAVYFAGMYRVFREERYRRAVADALEFLLEGDVEVLTAGIDIGAGNGFGSLTYGLSVVAELTGESRYRERARQCALSMTADDIEADDRYDVLAGAGGALAGLLRLYEQTDDHAVLAQAVRCGEHLLENRYDKWGYEVWDTYWSDNSLSFSTGMGHGAAGICYSLYRLYAHTNRAAFRDAADDALKFENVFYSEYENNWKANWTFIPHYPRWWCYGGPGIGLARLGSVEYHDSEALRRDLERARGLEPKLGSRDEICHGTFSQVDFLVELGRKFDRQYFERARKLAAAGLERRRETGSFRVVGGDVDGIYNPVLFMGTAGIGYTLLRLLRPEELPSVLRFE